MENNEELKYVPSATIVYNAGKSVLEDEPAVASAQDVTLMSRSVKRLQGELQDIRASIELVKEYLLENHEELDGHAQEIAEMLDIELLREVNVTVTVEFEVQLSLKPNESIDDVVDNMGFSVDTSDEIVDYYQGDVKWQES